MADCNYLRKLKIFSDTVVAVNIGKNSVTANIAILYCVKTAVFCPLTLVSLYCQKRLSLTLQF